MKKYITPFLLMLSFNNYTKIDTKKALEYDAWLQTLGEVINLFEQFYYKETVPSQVMTLAIKAFADQDPHTAFLDEKLFTELHEKMSGHFCGIGVVLPG